MINEITKNIESQDSDDNCELEILFEDLLSQEDDVSEKYLKKGPAARIVNQVRPIKIKMKNSKSGTVFYKTYYVKNTTHDRYRKRAGRDVAKGKESRYLLYTNQLDKMFQTRDKMPPTLLKKHGWWTGNVTQLSGAYNIAYDKFGFYNHKQLKIAPPELPKITRKDGVTRIFDVVHMKDTQIGKNGKVLDSSVSTEALYTDRKDGGVDFRYNTTIHDSKFSKLSEHYDSFKHLNEHGKPPYSMRVISGKFSANGSSMTIQNAGKFSAQELGYFVAGHERKIKNISMEINPANPNLTKTEAGGTEHLTAQASWLGFSAHEDNFKNWAGMKSEVLMHIQANYKGKEAETYTKLLQNSSSLNGYLFQLVDKKRIGRGITDDMISGYLKKIGAKSLNWTGSSKKRTTSQHMLNSHNLQKSPENEYHKGYITDYKIAMPREKY